MINVIQNPALYGVWPLTNYAKGRKGVSIDTVVIHGMAGTLPGTGSWFKNPLAHASSHFGVGSLFDGTLQVHQYVKWEDTAWGVNQSRAIVPSVNERSIHIEIQNQDRQGNPYVIEGYYTLTAALLVMVCQRLNRRPDRSFVKAHRELDPRKVECPKNIDVERIVRDAQAIWDGVPSGIDQPITQPEATGVLTSSAPTATSIFAPFTVDLAPSQNYREEVKRMQEFLVSKNLLTVPEGQWGFYGALTQTAVNAFQKLNGITSGRGYFGWWYTKTREAANRQLEQTHVN
jgi:hypothetical protein